MGFAMHSNRMERRDKQEEIDLSCAKYGCHICSSACLSSGGSELSALLRSLQAQQLSAAKLQRDVMQRCHDQMLKQTEELLRQKCHLGERLVGWRLNQCSSRLIWIPETQLDSDFELWLIKDCQTLIAWGWRCVVLSQVMCLVCPLIWSWFVLHESSVCSSAGICVMIHAPYLCQKESTSGYEGYKNLFTV